MCRSRAKGAYRNVGRASVTYDSKKNEITVAMTFSAITPSSTVLSSIDAAALQ